MGSDWKRKAYKARKKPAWTPKIYRRIFKNAKDLSKICSTRIIASSAKVTKFTVHRILLQSNFKYKSRQEIKLTEINKPNHGLTVLWKRW